MDKLFEIQSVILKSLDKVPYYPREWFKKITLDNHITGIVGQRGVGKTTFLLKQAVAHGANEQKALYASADNLYFVEHQLIDLVDTLYKESEVRLLCLDEIHKYPNWQQALKNIADSYPDFRLLFSGSSMIDLVKSRYDLARRVTLHHLPGFSFREYLAFYHEINLPLVTLQALMSNPAAHNNTLGFPEALRYFKAYLETGYYPFFKRLPETQDRYQAVVTSAQTTIFEDIATHHALKTPSLLVIEKLYQYILQANPGELNINKLATALDKDHDSIKTYLHHLAQAGLIHLVDTAQTGKAFLRKTAKIYPENTNMMFAHHLNMNDDTRGKMRETFVVNQLKNAGHAIHFSKQGDFRVETYTLEVGGKNKSGEQIAGIKDAFIIADGILTATPKRIPIFYLGCLY